MKIDCLAREDHHAEHARAIWSKLPEMYQSGFFRKLEDLEASKNKVVLCSSYGDLKAVSHLGRKAIFTDHGVGLYYNVPHPSYAGSTMDRECVILRLSPNERHAKKERETLTCPVEVIGVPKMDAWANRPPKLNRPKNRIVAVSFHFDATVCPETRSSWRHYMGGLGPLRDVYKVWGHAHPRIFKKLAPLYAKMGIKPIENFQEVMQRADIYACDNSSTIFEFAFTGKPVILLNSPLYRKYVTHEGNPRFWEYADIGIQVEKPEQLAEAVRRTFADPNERAARQKAIVEDMFAFTDGQCAERAVEAILKHLS